MKMPELKYKEVGSFEFASLIQKIANQPTNNQAASHINKIVKQITAARELIHEQYMKEIREKFAMRKEDGTVDTTGAGPGEDMYFNVTPDKMEEFKKAQDEFGMRLFSLNWRPLTPSTLKDVQLSAKDIDTLGELYTDEEGPGVPRLESVKK